MRVRVRRAHGRGLGRDVVLIPDFEFALRLDTKAPSLLRPEIAERLRVACPGAHEVLKLDHILPVALLHVTTTAELAFKLRCSTCGTRACAAMAAVVER